MAKKPIDVLVSCEDDFVDEVALKDLVHRLELKGLTVENPDTDFGIITGSVDSKAAIRTLGQVRGVKHVRQQHKVQLPHPTSRVQ